ncbi:hypothetical protein D3C86_1705130 [compost metagenome]
MDHDRHLVAGDAPGAVEGVGGHVGDAGEEAVVVGEGEQVRPRLSCRHVLEDVGSSAGAGGAPRGLGEGLEFPDEDLEALGELIAGEGRVAAEEAVRVPLHQVALEGDLDHALLGPVPRRHVLEGVRGGSGEGGRGRERHGGGDPRRGEEEAGSSKTGHSLILSFSFV